MRFIDPDGNCGTLPKGSPACIDQKGNPITTNDRPAGSNWVQGPSGNWQQSNDASLEVALGSDYNTSQTRINSSLAASATGFVLVAGGSANTGAGFDTDDNVCSVSTGCSQFGLGFLGGAGGEGTLGTSDRPLESGRTESLGFFVNGGGGIAEGASINFSEDGSPSAGGKASWVAVLDSR